MMCRWYLVDEGSMDAKQMELIVYQVMSCLKQ
jgi:hypothetical protein